MLTMIHFSRFDMLGFFPQVDGPASSLKWVRRVRTNNTACNTKYSRWGGPKNTRIDIRFAHGLLYHKVFFASMRISEKHQVLLQQLNGVFKQRVKRHTQWSVCKRVRQSKSYVWNVRPTACKVNPSIESLFLLLYPRYANSTITYNPFMQTEFYYFAAYEKSFERYMFWYFCILP